MVEPLEVIYTILTLGLYQVYKYYGCDAKEKQELSGRYQPLVFNFDDDEVKR